MRKSIRIKIEAEGRDKGKIFVLTEMSASRAEKWGLRALLLLVKSGVDVPESVLGSGMAGIASVGFSRLFQLDFRDAEELLDEMFTCVDIQPDPGSAAVVRALVEDDIEEVSTRVFLRAEVLKLHTGFSLADLISRSASQTQKPQSSSNIQI